MIRSTQTSPKLIGDPGLAATAPTAKSSESPGRNGVDHESGLGEDDPEEEHIEPGPNLVGQRVERVGTQVHEVQRAA